MMACQVAHEELIRLYFFLTFTARWHSDEFNLCLQRPTTRRG